MFKREKENKKNNRNKGFSLVELIVVIAIMAVLVAVLAPQFTKYIDRSRQSNDATTISSVVTAAQVGIIDSENEMAYGTYVITFPENQGEPSVTATINEVISTDEADKLKDVIESSCGTFSELKLTASGWTQDIEVTITYDVTVEIEYSTEFAKYIQ